MEINTFTITIQKCLLPTTAHLFLCKYSSPVRAQIGRKHSSFSTIFYNTRDHATSLQHNEPWAPLTMSLELHLQWALSSPAMQQHTRDHATSLQHTTIHQRPCNVSATQWALSSPSIRIFSLRTQAFSSKTYIKYFH